MNNLAGMLALLTDRNGGEISFTTEDLQSIPNAAFRIDIKDNVYTLRLTYDEKAMNELRKHREEAAKIQAEMELEEPVAAELELEATTA